MVCVAKKSKINDPRITVDFKPVNHYVKQLGYPTKVPAEDVMDIPPGIKFFTVLDARHGYWQVSLSEESKCYVHLFHHNVGTLPLKVQSHRGLISAGDKHNLRGNRALTGLENIKKIVEDIVIYDKEQDTHLARVREVLERCQAAGITLHRKKAQFAHVTVECFMYTLTEAGYFPREGLVDALTHFLRPVSKRDMRSFCGLVHQF